MMSKYAQGLSARMWTMVLGTDEELVDYRDHYSKVDSALYRKLVQHGKRCLRLQSLERKKLYVCSEHI